MIKPLLLCALLAVVACSPAHADMTVYAIDALTRVMPDDPPQDASSIHIYSARNEYEPFQVVVRAGTGRLTNVNATISDFLSRDGNAHAGIRAALFREHYVEVSTSSPKSLGPGMYPDALIPFTTPPGVRRLDRARFTGAPFDVDPGKNQPLWIDVYVARETPRGVYEADLTVTADGMAAQHVGVTLTVWEITLPETPSMRSDFGKLGADIADKHGVVMNSEEFLIPEWNYAAELAACRISPIIPNTRYPRVGPDGSIDPTRTHERLKQWIDAFHVTSFPLRLLGDDPTGRDRERNLTHLRAMYAYLEKHGWEDKAYVWVFDEPDNAAEYEEARRRAKLVRDAHPEIETLCIEQPIPDNPEWGSLIGNVNIWCPMWSLFDEASVSERLRAGEAVWSYTAQTQGKRGQDTPFWQIDFPLLNYRVPSWLNWRYGLTGLVYWSPTYWTVTKDMWTDPVTYRVEWLSAGSPRPDVFVFNGEGALFYPGPDAGLDGPVVSMRLKQIREGLEDYEYIKLLDARGGTSRAREIANTVARSWTDWEKDPKKLYAARAAMARELVSGE